MPITRSIAASTTLLLAYGIGSCIGPVAAATVMDRAGPNDLFWINAACLLLLAVYLVYRIGVYPDVPEAERTAFYTTTVEGGGGLYELDPRNDDFDGRDSGSADPRADTPRAFQSASAMEAAGDSPR